MPETIHLYIREDYRDIYAWAKEEAKRCEVGLGVVIGEALRSLKGREVEREATPR